MRIIPDDLWRSAQQRLSELTLASGADHPRRMEVWTKRRPLQLLTGKTFRRLFAGTMTNIGRDRIACSAAVKQGRAVTGKASLEPRSSGVAVRVT